MGRIAGLLFRRPDSLDLFAQDVERTTDRDKIEIDGDNLAPCNVNEMVLAIIDGTQ